MAQAIDPARRQQQRRQRDAVFTDEHDPVPGPDAKRGEALRSLTDVSIKVAVCPFCAILDHCNAVRRVDNVPFRYFMEAPRQ